jgi:CRISPR-associated protein Cas1
LPEEVRLIQENKSYPARLFPEDDDRQIIHILEPGTSVGKSGEQFKITRKDRSVDTIPSREVGQLVLHSYAQLSTQALYFCAEHDIGVHFISGGGRYLGSFDTRQGSIQRRIRQYKALSDPERCLQLSRQLVSCRGQSQRKFLMRGQRGENLTSDVVTQAIEQMQRILKQVPQAESIPSLLGLEGNIAALYFEGLPHLLSENAAPEFQFSGRNRRPPQDRFNALLSFGYALLLKDVMNAILVVGLEPALGFYHQPRTQAPPLALDLMEIFRVPLVDLPVMGSINRNQWDVQADFEIRGNQVWLSESGRRKFIGLYERRKEESWKHPVTGYSLTYRRLIELEVRLLEKEWMGEGGLFAQLVIR